MAWVAGDEQTVFLPGERHLQSPFPSELLLSIWRRFCAMRLLVCVSCVCFVSLLVYFWVFLYFGVLHLVAQMVFEAEK